ncbi:MAG: SurA N-terminal domain-containing protein [Gammaproteobacteria bacterium]|nr:SurA N-terminal domain-containing protein [Gammaproteobacteria bacterium]
MLQAIRDKVTGWIAYGIIFLISIPFALWGVNSYFGGGEAPPAAVVNGEEISLQELDRAYANYRQRLIQLFGGSMPETLGDEQALRQRVLDQLVEEFALRQYAFEQRYRISDADLNNMIRSMDAFQRDGGFDSEIYQAQLRSLGYSTLGFEQELRRSRAIEQLQAGIRGTAFTVPAIAQEFAELAGQERRIRSLRFSPPADAVEVTAEEIEQRYLALPQLYQTPEQVRIEYIEVSLESVKAGIGIDPADLRRRYEDNLSAYSSPEIRRASHILLQADDENSDEVRQRIADVRARIEGGEAFADLARELSDDPVSAAEGGALGEIERGIMVAAFEAALFALEVGQLSEPVRTSFGWHLILLHEVTGGEVQAFESVRAELEDELRTEQAESQIFDLVEGLSNLAYEQPDSLLPAAEQLGLELRQSDWFDRGSGQGIAAEAPVRNAAFAGDVYSQGLNSEAIELGNDRIVFLRLAERRDAATKPLETVEAQIRAELLRSGRREASLKAGIEALEMLNSGTSLEQLARQWSAVIDDHGFVARGASEPESMLVDRAFRMPRPDAAASFDGVVVPDGDYVVVELAEVRVSAEASASDDLTDNLANTVSAADYQSLLRLLTRQAEVVRTPPDELDY